MSLNSDQILGVINDIAATSSTKQKEAMVKALITDVQFARVLEAAYNPLKSYGIAIRPDTIGDHCGNHFDDGTWELITDLETRKLTGAAAIEAVRGELTALTKDSAELLWRILSKDLRAGFGETIINKAMKGLIPEFPYMRCSLPKHVKLAEWPWAAGVLSQEKADGMFVNVDIEAGGVVFRSRQGNAFPVSAAITALSDEIARFMAEGTQLHGELLVQQVSHFDDLNGTTSVTSRKTLPREEGNGMLNSLLSGGSLEEGYSLKLLVWDQIPLSAVKGKTVVDRPYVLRLKDLSEQTQDCSMAICVIDTKVVRSVAEAYAHFAELLAQGKEGTIIKKPTAVWKDGTSREQVKLKLEFDIELRVKGFEPGNGKNAATFGSLMCESECGQLKVNVSGFKDALRQEIHDNREGWLDGVITVRANEIMKPGPSSDFYSLFLPRFVERRLDKGVADDLQRIKDQKEAAMAV